MDIENVGFYFNATSLRLINDHITTSVFFNIHTEIESINIHLEMSTAVKIDDCLKIFEHYLCYENL